MRHWSGLGRCVVDAFRDVVGFLVTVSNPSMPCPVDARVTQRPLPPCAPSVNSTSVWCYEARVYAHLESFVSFDHPDEFVGYAALSDACNTLIKHPVTERRPSDHLVMISTS
ncbi:hypothetical protein OG21DRAFT_1337009 [Imleria badia]|nr:hypothetical protein OG21DRAFT_1337009 [Imleria badia]